MCLEDGHLYKLPTRGGIDPVCLERVGRRKAGVSRVLGLCRDLPRGVTGEAEYQLGSCLVTQDFGCVGLLACRKLEEVVT